MNKTSILVVEDESIVALDIEDRLTKMGYTVAGSTGSGEEALAAAAAYLPDLVLMDIHLKGSMDGIRAAAEIRSRFHLPVIFLTAYSEEKTLERAKQAEPFGYILKPFKERDLKSAIELALYKHRSEMQLRRMNRLFNTLNQIGQSIMRIGNREDLLSEVCRLVVDQGVVDLAWIGWLNRDKSQLQHVAGYGRHCEQLQAIDLGTLAPPDGENGPGKALLEGMPFVSNSLSRNTGPRFPHNAAIHPSFQSTAFFPIQMDRQTSGAMCLCTFEPDYWCKSELDVFMKAATDISLALEKIQADIRRRETEEALRESQERLQLLISATPDCVQFKDGSGRWLIANEAALKIFQLEGVDYRGKKDSELSLSSESFRKDLLTCEQTDELAWQSRTPIRSDEAITAPDGTEKVFDLIKVPLFHADGGRKGLIVLGRDVTERKQAELAIEQEAGQRRTLMEQSRDGIVTLDENGKVFEANRAFTDMLGYTMEEMAQLYVWDWDAQMSRQELEEAVRLIDASGDHFASRHRRKDGTLIDVDITTTAIVRGPQKRIFCNCRDISERLKAEETLRERERRYRTVADYTYDWEYWVQPDGSLAYVSPSCERLTGFSAGEFIQNPGLMASIAHPDDRPWMDDHLNECRHQDRKICQKDFRIVTRQGEVRWISHNCLPVQGDDGTYLGRRASNRDISDRMKVLEEKEKIEEQLRQSQKLEAIGTLAGGIAHDFNNILSPIIGYTEMALDEIPESDPARFGLNQVLHAAHRARDLVKQILAFSRQGEKNFMVPVDVSRIVKEALKLLRATLPSSIDIRQHTEKAMVVADPTQIHQIVVNLCTNAAHAMENKGVLDVTLLNAVLTEKDLSALSLFNLKPGRYIRLHISDTGSGITADTLPRIFEPYFTTKGVGKGSGLGLAVVHGIVKRHGGDIRVQSKPGKGSTFEVFIPATEEVQPPETRDSRALPGGSERILLVDDEPMITELGEKMLKRLGYQVSSVSGSPEALDLFRSNPAGFDLIITDYTMPRMSGTDLAREIKRIRTDIPVILCTGISEQLSEETIREAGIQKLAPKPLDKTQLAEIVRKVLDNRPA